MCERDYENQKLVITKFSLFCKRETQIFVLVRMGPYQDKIRPSIRRSSH